jgi:hypothetical protein
MKLRPGPPMTLGGAAAAGIRLIVWCRECHYQVEAATASLRAAEGGTSADPAEMARRYGPETPVPDWQVGSFVPNAGVALRIWSSPASDGEQFINR